MKTVCQNYVLCLRRGIEYVHWITETEKEMMYYCKKYMKAGWIVYSIDIV